MYNSLFQTFYSRVKGTGEDFVMDKDRAIIANKGYMFSRLNKMFKYDNLPKTIPHEILEYYLMSNGSCLISRHDDGNLYAYVGNFGGELDVYYRPTIYIVANPALRLSKSYNMWKLDGTLTDECVFMRNDVFWTGLNPLVSKYASMLAENMITLRVADIMLRVVAMLTAPDDKSKVAAEEYLKKIEFGKLGVIGENRFFDGMKMQSPPSNNGSYLTQFIELNQYLIGSFYNEVGLSASINMKREAINQAEAKLNDDVLTPLIDMMYMCRKEDVSRLNEVYDLDVSVNFDSSWYENLIERNLVLLKLKSESNIKTNGKENSDDGIISENEFNESGSSGIDSADKDRRGFEEEDVFEETSNIEDSGDVSNIEQNDSNDDGNASSNDELVEELVNDMIVTQILSIIDSGEKDFVDEEEDVSQLTKDEESNEQKEGENSETS